MILRTFMFPASLAIGLVLLLALGNWYQSSQERLDSIAAPGVFVGLPSTTLHLHCTGAGEATVVLEAGLGGSYATWGHVQELLEGEYRVCSYDRQGIGWSSEASEPSTPSLIAKNLHDLLRAADVDPPYILVGFSAGGIHTREFYHLYPDLVAGMVLVDSSHDQQLRRLSMMRPLPADVPLYSLCDRLAWTGIIRLAGLGSSFSSMPKDSPYLRADAATLNRTEQCIGQLLEHRGLFNLLTQDREPRPLGDLPIYVLSRGAFHFRGGDDQAVSAYREAWSAMQSELAGLSSLSTLEVIDGVGHRIPTEAPQAIKHAVDGLINRP